MKMEDAYWALEAERTKTFSVVTDRRGISSSRHSKIIEAWMGRDDEEMSKLVGGKKIAAYNRLRAKEKEFIRKYE